MSAAPAAGEARPEERPPGSEADAPGRGRRAPWAFLPLVLFLGLAAIFLVRLYAGDPSALPSALVGRAAPALALPPLPGLVREGRPVPGLEANALASGRPSLVNVFASWCGPCHEEHPLLMALAEGGVSIVGMNHKDQPENARRFLGAKGNPYAAVGVDPSGRAGIEWGVYGVPETFLIGPDGTILDKHVGPLTPEVVERKLKPALARLARPAAEPSRPPPR